MNALAEGWSAQIERGPDCLFIRLDCSAKDNCDFSNLAEQIWSILTQHFTYRLVLELERVPLLRSELIGQLMMLQKRISDHDGMLRICGLSPGNQQVLRTCRIAPRLPHYLNREDAVLGARPHRPR